MTIRGSVISRQFPGPRMTWSVAILLAICTTLLNGAIEQKFDQLQVFDQYNVLFDADPNIRLEGFANGWGDSYTIHPNLVNFLNPPIRVVARLSALAGAAPSSEIAARRALALWIAPMASGAKALVLFATLRFLGLGLFAVSSLVVLHGASFTQLILGSVPDHDILNGLTIALATLASIALVQDSRLRVCTWLAISVAGIGITVTNGIAIGLLLWTALLATGERIVRSTVATAAIISGATVITLAIAIPMDKLYGVTLSSAVNAGKTSAFVTKYFRDDILQGYLTFPTAVISGIAPPAPSLVENVLGVKEHSHYSIQFSLEPAADQSPSFSWLGLTLLAATIIGAVRLARGGVSHRVALAGALTVILFNWALHGIWGTESFLYSQQWHVPVLVLIGGLAIGTHVRVGEVALAVITIVVVVLNTALLQDMFVALAAAHH